MKTGRAAIPRMGDCTCFWNICAPRGVESLLRQQNTFSVHFTGNKCSNSAKVPFVCVRVCESSLCPTQINWGLPQTVCHFPLFVCPFPNLEHEQEALEMVGGTVVLHTPGPFPLICYVRKLPGTRLRLLISTQSEAASDRKNKNRPPHSAAKQILIEGPFSARSIVF